MQRLGQLARRLAFAGQLLQGRVVECRHLPHVRSSLACGTNGCVRRGLGHERGGIVHGLQIAVVAAITTAQGIQLVGAQIQVLGWRAQPLCPVKLQKFWCIVWHFMPHAAREIDQ